MSVVITEKAAGEVKRIIEEQKLEEGTVLRVGVAGGGCSGFRVSRRVSRGRQKKRPLLGWHHGRFLRRCRKTRLYL